MATLADIGVLNAFTHDRRSALWQAERPVRPAGELFREGEEKTIPFLLVDGIMQQQVGVRSVKAERLEALGTLTASVDAHDFY